jgi:basic amino acid/polyamine antiporter, APA family
MLVMLFGQSRIFFAMSRDGLLPAFFSSVNSRTHTPSKSILFIGIVTAFIAGLFPLATVAELVNMGTLVAFSIVAFGVLVLRHQQPDLNRPFRCPCVPLIPILCIGSCAFLILHLKYIAHLMFLIWLCIGLALYFLYGVRNSENRRSAVNTGPGSCLDHIPPELLPPRITGSGVTPGLITDPEK